MVVLYGKMVSTCVDLKSTLVDIHLFLAPAFSIWSTVSLCKFIVAGLFLSRFECWCVIDLIRPRPDVDLDLFDLTETSCRLLTSFPTLHVCEQVLCLLSCHIFSCRAVDL